MKTPRYPLYIPSKSRADTALTPRVLDEMGVPYHLVVEQAQHAQYAAKFDPASLLILPKRYQDEYDTCDDLGDTKSRGPGPARNFIWDHSIEAGYDWHWVMDDNIRYFARLHQNQRVRVGDGLIFCAMEDFVQRYTNIGMAGPIYSTFAPPQIKFPPYILNTRIYSCNFIRNDLPFRWRGRYNEDTDLSLRILKIGLCTVQFYAFLQDKVATQQIKGGNTEAFYAKEGTKPKSRMLVDMHPDVAKLVWRYGRWHHHVDYSPFAKRGLERRPDYSATTTYRMKRVGRI